MLEEYLKTILYDVLILKRVYTRTKDAAKSYRDEWPKTRDDSVLWYFVDDAANADLQRGVDAATETALSIYRELIRPIEPTPSAAELEAYKAEKPRLLEWNTEQKAKRAKERDDEHAAR